MKQVLLALTLPILLLVGCASAPIQMDVNRQAEMSPLGIFIITSRQGTSAQLGQRGKDFVTDVTAKSLSRQLSEKQYDAVDLNSLLPVEEVFRKTSVSYEIDEKKIAMVAAQHGCKTVLIEYFAFAGEEVRLSQDLSLFENCSAYAWLVDAQTRGIVMDTHMPLVQLNERTSAESESTETYERALRLLSTRLLSFGP